VDKAIETGNIKLFFRHQITAVKYEEGEFEVLNLET
jgi:hypothetical protein